MLMWFTPRPWFDRFKIFSLEFPRYIGSFHPAETVLDVSVAQIAGTTKNSSRNRLEIQHMI